MGGSFPIMDAEAFIESEKICGEDRFRWQCSCKRDFFPKETRKGNWHRNIWSVLESFRQHWGSVHADFPEPDWAEAHQKALQLSGWSGQDVLARLSGQKVTVKLDKVSKPSGEWVEATISATGKKEGMSRLDDIQARLRELEKEAAKYARFARTDEYEVGTVIVYDQETSTGESYTYAVLKCANQKWYWTGHGVYTKSGASYDHLVEHLAHERTSNIRIADSGDFRPFFLEDQVGSEIAEKVEQGLKDIEDGKGVHVVRPEKSA